jgi:hypothetical protein
MGISEQLSKLKENWLLIVILLVVVVFLSGGSGVMRDIGGAKMYAAESMAMDAAYGGAARSYMPSPGYGEDFAPEVDERIITKTASMSAEVERGEFKQAENQLKGIVAGADGYLLNENANQVGEGWTAYYRGSYSIKVPVLEYDRVVSELKLIGEVKSFNENAQDITGSYVSVEDQLEVERGRLERYEAMMDETENVEEKLQLTDRIYNQERTIKYLEDRLEGMDKRVDYATVSVSLTEEQSSYVNVQLVKLGQLVRSLVNSFNNLLTLVFWALPWLVALFLIRVIWKIVKRKKA